MRTETVYWNVTGKGDIDAYVVVVTDDPQNQVHKAHALLKQTLRRGVETVRDRLSCHSRKDAETHAKAWCHMIDKNPNYKKASCPS